MDAREACDAVSLSLSLYVHTHLVLKKRSLGPLGSSRLDWSLSRVLEHVPEKVLVTKSSAEKEQHCSRLYVSPQASISQSSQQTYYITALGFLGFFFQ